MPLTSSACSAGSWPETQASMIDDKQVIHLRQRLGIPLAQDNVAKPCSRTPTLPPVGDDTWSMVLFPYDLNQFSPKHKICHLCASFSAKEKHLNWSERKGFWFFGILIINYHWFLFTKTFMRQWYLKPSITCALPHMINYYDFSITSQNTSKWLRRIPPSGKSRIKPKRNQGIRRRLIWPEIDW